MTNEMTIQIIVYVIGLIATALITAFISEGVKQKRSKFSKDKEDLIELKNEEREEVLKKEILEEVSKTIKSELKEGTKELKKGIIDLQEQTNVLSQKITVLEDNVSKQGEGLTSSLRNDIHKRYLECKAKGYRTSWDTQSVDHMFESYERLGGNSFVKECIEEFHDLPLEDK